MRDSNNAFEILSEERFRQFYRLPKTLAWDLIEELSVLNEQMGGIQFYQKVSEVFKKIKIEPMKFIFLFRYLLL